MSERREGEDGSADAPDLDDLARRYLDLWQDQISAMAADPELLNGFLGWLAGRAPAPGSAGSATASSAMAAAVTAWQTAAQQALAAFTASNPTRNDDPPRNEKNGGSEENGDSQRKDNAARGSTKSGKAGGAKAPAAAPVDRDVDVDGLQDRFAALERRLAALERRLADKGGENR